MTYAEKLKDPRWQKKRLEIMERDHFACYLCDDPTSMLHIHHRMYINEAEGPWDYKNHMLLTVCEDCHDWLHGLDQMSRHRVEKLISRSLYLGKITRWLDEEREEKLKPLDNPEDPG